MTQVPIIEVTFTGMNADAEIDALIRHKAGRLHEICPHLVSCRVAVGLPHQHPRSGSLFAVRIDLRLPPGRELVVHRKARDGDIHDTMRIAVNEAFDSAATHLRRELEIQRGQTKQHPHQQVQGVITQLHDDFGFVRTTDERQVYFHPHAVVGEFDSLEQGQGVAITVAMGDQGPQASTVRVVDHRGHEPV